MKLCERITERALVVGDMAYPRPGRLKDEEVKDDFKSSGAILKMEMMTTVTDLLAAAKKMEGWYPAPLIFTVLLSDRTVALKGISFPQQFIHFPL